MDRRRITLDIYHSSVDKRRPGGRRHAPDFFPPLFKAMPCTWFILADIQQCRNCSCPTVKIKLCLNVRRSDDSIHRLINIQTFDDIDAPILVGVSASRRPIRVSGYRVSLADDTGKNVQHIH